MSDGPILILPLKKAWSDSARASSLEARRDGDAPKSDNRTSKGTDYIDRHGQPTEKQMEDKRQAAGPLPVERPTRGRGRWGIDSAARAAMRQIGFPTLDNRGGGIYWSSRGGYRGQNTIRATVDRAKKAGFVKQDTTHSGSPDGNVVGNGTVYKHPDGHTLTVDQSFGVTKDDNHYSMRLKLSKKD